MPQKERYFWFFIKCPAFTRFWYAFSFFPKSLHRLIIFIVAVLITAPLFPIIISLDTVILVLCRHAVQHQGLAVILQGPGFRKIGTRIGFVRNRVYRKHKAFIAIFPFQWNGPFITAVSGRLSDGSVKRKGFSIIVPHHLLIIDPGLDDDRISFLFDLQRAGHQPFRRLLKIGFAQIKLPLPGEICLLRHA